jgi:hypothetical protein
MYAYGEDYNGTGNVQWQAMGVFQITIAGNSEVLFLCRWQVYHLQGYISKMKVLN